MSNVYRASLSLDIQISFVMSSSRRRMRGFLEELELSVHTISFDYQASIAQFVSVIWIAAHSVTCSINSSKQ